MTRVSPEDLEAFVQVFEASDWDRAYVCVDGTELHLSKTAGSRVVRRQISAPASEANSDPPATTVATLEVTAPHVATFHRGTSPGGPACVEVGQSVAPGMDVGRLSVLHESIPLRAESAGVIREICAADGALVEFGQVLLRIETAA